MTLFYTNYTHYDLPKRMFYCQCHLNKMWESSRVMYTVFKTMRHVTATGCCNKSPRVMWKPLSLRSVAQIQNGLNSCDVSQQQNKHKQPCRTVCTHLGQVAATKFKSTNEKASILVSCHVKFELVYFSSLPKLIMCTEQVSYRSDLSQDQCRRGDLSPRCVAAIYRIVCLGLYLHVYIVLNQNVLV